MHHPDPLVNLISRLKEVNTAIPVGMKESLPSLPATFWNLATMRSSRKAFIPIHLDRL